jgi:dynein heavy chain 1
MIQYAIPPSPPPPPLSPLRSRLLCLLCACLRPNKQLIAQVMLYSQGFRTAEPLSGKVVLLFQLCQDQLSSQSHYDFGLRALKSVLRSAGGLKRTTVQELDGEVKKDKAGLDVKDSKEVVAAKPTSERDWLALEQSILVKSMCSTLVPKLISEDVGLFSTLLTAVFPDAQVLFDASRSSFCAFACSLPLSLALCAAV